MNNENKFILVSSSSSFRSSLRCKKKYIIRLNILIWYSKILILMKTAISVTFFQCKIFLYGLGDEIQLKVKNLLFIATLFIFKRYIIQLLYTFVANNRVVPIRVKVIQLLNLYSRWIIFQRRAISTMLCWAMEVIQYKHLMVHISHPK